MHFLTKARIHASNNRDSITIYRVYFWDIFNFLLLSFGFPLIFIIFRVFFSSPYSPLTFSQQFFPRYTMNYQETSETLCHYGKQSMCTIRTDPCHQLYSFPISDSLVRALLTLLPMIIVQCSCSDLETECDNQCSLCP